jgi:hypothetical protein
MSKEQEGGSHRAICRLATWRASSAAKRRAEAVGMTAKVQAKRQCGRPRRTANWLMASDHSIPRCDQAPGFSFLIDAEHVARSGGGDVKTNNVARLFRRKRIGRQLNGSERCGCRPDACLVRCPLDNENACRTRHCERHSPDPRVYSFVANARSRTTLPPALMMYVAR